MALPRTTQIFNTLFKPDSSPNTGAPVLLALLPTATGITYNVAPLVGDTISATVLSTFTAGTAPTTVITGTPAGSGSGGIVAGNYKYSFSYYNSTTNTESAQSAFSSTITATSTGINNLTAITAGPTGTTARRVYRTTINGATSTAVLLTIIADNTTTVYADSTADSSLGTDAPLVLGEYRLNTIALGDLLPNTGLYYQLTQNGQVVYITTFAYSGTALLATTLFSSSPATATPTSAFTGYVFNSDGTARVGVQITATLSSPGISTVSGSTINPQPPVTTITDVNGAYTLNLVPTDRLTVGGHTYTVVEGPGGNAKIITAPNGGGVVNSLITNVPAAQQTSLRAYHHGGLGTSTTAVNANAGTAAAKNGSNRCDDFSGLASWTSGSGSWATGAQFNLTFAQLYGAAPEVTLIPITTGAITAYNAGHVTYTASTTGFSINLTVADSGATDHRYRYIVTIPGPNIS